jgi:hypothetical protein
MMISPTGSKSEEQRMKRTITILVLGLFTLSACVFFGPPTPTVQTFNDIQTAYIQTLTARPGFSQSTPTLTLATSSPVPTSATVWFPPSATVWFPPSATPIPSTAIPIPPTATFIPPTNVVTQTPVVVPAALTPEQFIRFYYNQINLRNYSVTWSLLSANFQNSVNGPLQGGYQGYINFWDTVNRVDVSSVSVLSQSYQYSDVRVNARYIYFSGSATTSNQIFHLIFDVSRNTWLFD